MTTVYLYEWDISYDEFRDWISRNDAEVFSSAGFPQLRYEFKNECDFLAFSLEFSRSGNDDAFEMW